jgi:hypothetical protein
MMSQHVFACGKRALDATIECGTLEIRHTSDKLAALLLAI